MSEPAPAQEVDLSNVPTDDLTAIGRWLEKVGQHVFPNFTRWLHGALVLEMERRLKDPFAPPQSLIDFRPAPDEWVGEALVAAHLLSYSEGLRESTARDFIDNLAHRVTTLAAVRLGFKLHEHLTEPPQSLN